MKPTLIALIIAPVLLGLCSDLSFGRAVRLWSYEELVAKSDVVAVVEPLENQPAKDTFPGHRYGRTTDDFVATNTRFKVHVMLKGDRESPAELALLHFSYSPSVGGIVNGAHFIRFSIGPLQYERRAVKDGKPIGGVTTFQQEPLWLAFLKRREDGRFEPVTGHYDSARSFRQLHEPSCCVSP
jgi:hypothetical protein